MLEFWRVYLLKNIKMLHDELLYDESLNSYHNQIYMSCRLGKHFTIIYCLWALSFVKHCWPLGTSHAFKIKITYTPPIYASPTQEVRIHHHFIWTHTKLFYSYKNIPFIHPLPFSKAPIISCCYLPFHYLEKRFECSIKEKKKRTKVPTKKTKRKKNRATKTLPKTSNKGRYVFKEQRIPLSPLHSNPLYTTHMHILIWLYDLILWIHCFTLQYMFTSVYELSPHLWAPHKPLSYKVRERGHLTMPITKIPQTLREERRQTSWVPWRGSTNTTYQRLERVIHKNLWVLFENHAKTLEWKLIKELEA